MKKSNVDEAYVQLHMGTFFQKLCPISPFSFLPILGRKFFCGSRDLGMAIWGGEGGWSPKDGVFAPVPHDRKNFLAPSLPFRVLWSPTPPYKTLLLVNLPTTIIIVLIKHVLLIKIYLKIQINLSHQIKLIFSKNWIIFVSA